jgi:hypothetical protein
MQGGTLMRPIAESVGKPLKWIQPTGLQGDFELRDGEDVLGTLAVQSLTGTLAEGECGSGRWSFKRVGFFSPHITVRAAAGHENLAVFAPKVGGGGTLTFREGPVFAWTSGDIWRSSWDFRAEDGLILVSLRPSEGGGLPDLLKTQAAAEVSIAARDLPQMPVLVLLGWYLVIMGQRDAATIAATVGSIGG